MKNGLSAPIFCKLGLSTLDVPASAIRNPTCVGRLERREPLRYYRPEQIFLNTDCGFCCFANRCVNVEEVATAKLHSIVQAARMLRERYG